jgi:hypothetical protein
MSKARNPSGPEAKTKTAELSFFELPVVGSSLTVLAGLAFMLVCMVLPLVGRAGMAAPHAAKNYWAFLTVLLVCMGLSVGAVYSKLMRRRLDGSPWPVFSPVLLALCVLLLGALLAGLLWL